MTDMNNGFWLAPEARGKPPYEMNWSSLLRRDHPDPASIYTTYDFFHSTSYAFALALHEKFGYGIESVRDESNKLIHAFAVDYSVEKPIYIDARGCTDNFESFMAAFYRDTSHSHTSHTVEYAKNVYQSICEMGSQDAFQSAMRAIGKKRDVYDAAKLGQRKPSLSSLINGALRSAAENNVQPPSRGMNISQKTQGR